MVQTPRSLGALGWAGLLAVAPLAAGCAIFVLWCATEWEFLQGLGFLNIMFGLLAVAVGACCLVVHFVRIAGASPYPWAELAKMGAIVCVMALNFPVCVTIVDAVIRLESINRMRDSLTMSSVRVINVSDETTPRPW